MLLVKTTLACSPIHGIGLFADQCILQGTRIWEFTPGFTLKLSGAFLAQAAEPLRSWLYTHTYLGRSEVFTRLRKRVISISRKHPIDYASAGL